MDYSSLEQWLFCFYELMFFCIWWWNPLLERDDGVWEWQLGTSSRKIAVEGLLFKILDDFSYSFFVIVVFWFPGCWGYFFFWTLVLLKNINHSETWFYCYLLFLKFLLLVCMESWLYVGNSHLCIFRPPPIFREDLKMKNINQVQCPVLSSQRLKRLRQENCKFQDSLSNLVRP